MHRSLLRRLILKHTQPTRQHLTPEINLHLITPDCPLWTANAIDSPFSQDPFWAFYWPGGQALTRYILDNSRVFQDKTILDVGSGCGSASLAASLVGAKTVIANDIDSAALMAIEMNEEINTKTGNGNNILVDGRNWLSVSDSTTTAEMNELDFILLGDMFYDPDFADLISDWLKSVNRKSKSKTTTVLIGDPGRLSFNSHPMRRFLTNLAEYDLSETYQLENNGFTQGGVWRWNNGT